MKKLSMTVAGAAFFALGAVSAAKAAVINFDIDADGDSINAPGFFAETTSLTDLYAPLGVQFSGPGGNDSEAFVGVQVDPGSNNGGAILNQVGIFGVSARSGENFLAFNRDTSLSDDGIPTDPETISFDTPLTDVSIFAASGFDTNTFQLNAFDINNSLVGSSTVTTSPGTYEQLSVSSASGDISQVVLTAGTSGDFEDNAFVYDNLSFTPVPEPSSVLGTFAFGAFGAGLMLKRRYRKKVVG